ncbi:alpha/beta hydrolase [Acidisoma sp. 7E03]
MADHKRADAPFGIARRTLLATGACLGLSHRARAATDRITLWPGPPPGGGGPHGPLRVSPRGAVRNIAVPCLEVFRPARANGGAMLIAAGGGYERIERVQEAYPAAHWLAARGITAFVLLYRLPPEGWTLGPLAPLQDAQRAIRLIRQQAPAYGLDPARLGVLGFSAGGHLMGLASAWAEFQAYAPIDAADRQSARPAAAALIYPVITLLPPYDHTETRRALIGRHPDRQQGVEWSVQTHVGPDCPPVFLVQAADDPIADPANSALMQAACQRAGVPVERHLLPRGGHGFGMGQAGTPTAQWPDWFAAWLRRQGLAA